MNLSKVSAYTGRAVREDRFNPGSAPERAFKEQSEPKLGLAVKRGFHGFWFRINCFVSVLDCPMTRVVPVQELSGFFNQTFLNDGQRFLIIRIIKVINE